MADYGSDFKLVDDDIVFTADGDVDVISGPALVAQDIDQTLKITPGRLLWDKETGSSLMMMLNDAGVGADAVIAELERVATDDPRVDPLSVHPEQIDDKKFRLEFRPLGAVKRETLDFDVGETQ